MDDIQSAKRSKGPDLLSAISLAGFAEGFRLYVRTWRGALLHRGRFAQRASPSEPPIALGASLAVFVYGVALAYVFYLWVVHQTNLSYPKFFFLFQHCYWQAACAFIAHLSLKCVGGKGSWERTASVYCTSSALLTPAFILVSIPLFLAYPSVDLLEIPESTKVEFWRSYEQSQAAQAEAAAQAAEREKRREAAKSLMRPEEEWEEEDDEDEYDVIDQVFDQLFNLETFAPKLPKWQKLVVLTVWFFVLLVPFYFWLLRWFAFVHRIRYWRVLVSLLVAAPLMFLNQLFVWPIISNVVRFVSVVLEQLI